MFNLASVTALAGLAAWRGGPRERVMAAVQWGIAANGQWHLLPPNLDLLGDLLGLGAALVCAATGRSYWTIWAAAALLVSLVSDIIFLLDPGLGLWGYRSTELVFWYAANAAVLWGVLGARRTPASADGRPMAATASAWR